jgi:hypothetical protein
MSSRIVLLCVLTISLLLGAAFLETKPAPVNAMGVSIEGMTPRDAFALVYLVKLSQITSSSPSEAYSFADAVMNLRRR